MHVIDFVSREGEILEWEIEVPPNLTVYDYADAIHLLQRTMTERFDGAEHIRQRSFLQGVCDHFVTWYAYLSIGCTKFWWLVIGLGSVTISMTALITSFACDMFC